MILTPLIYPLIIARLFFEIEIGPRSIAPSFLKHFFEISNHKQLNISLNMNVFIKNVLYQWKPADCNMTADSHLIALQDRQDVLLRFAHSYFPQWSHP